MINYREVDTCYSCRYVVAVTNYDVEKEYFCNVDGSERPPSGSIQMGEYTERPNTGDPHQFLDYRDVRNEEDRKWKEWSITRCVKPWGVCSLFQRIDQSMIQIISQVGNLKLKKSFFVKVEQIGRGGDFQVTLLPGSPEYNGVCELTVEYGKTKEEALERIKYRILSDWEWVQSGEELGPEMIVKKRMLEEYIQI